PFYSFLLMKTLRFSEYRNTDNLLHTNINIISPIVRVLSNKFTGLLKKPKDSRHNWQAVP
ncbi:MAG: hypothetical protein ABFD66_12360, partial [Smithella sp.]